MPQRHSKNQGAMGSMVTHAEKQKLKDGTQTVRYGVDSQLPFGYCSLTLSPVEDPVVTPSGHLYSRAPMFEYLLKKKQDLKRQAARFEAQQARRAAEALDQQAASADAAVEQFIDSQTSVIGNAQPEAPAAKKRRRNDDAGAKGAEVGVSSSALVIKKLTQEVGDPTTRDTLKRTSYWVPQFTPAHREAEVEAPPERPPSPMTGQGLRLKDLFAVSLEVDADTADAQDKKYVCAVSRKQITYQPAVLLKKANCVVLESIFNELVKPTMTCPISGEKLRKKDIIHLARSGSSFAAGGTVEVSVYRPTTT